MKLCISTDGLIKLYRYEGIKGFYKVRNGNLLSLIFPDLYHIPMLASQHDISLNLTSTPYGLIIIIFAHVTKYTLMYFIDRYRYWYIAAIK